jgi:O-antigen/teichoic acid export membrane protein
MHPRRWIPLASGAQMVALAGGAVTNILYARLLSPIVIGEVAILVAIATAIVLLADSGLDLLLTRELAQQSREPSEVIGVLVGALPGLIVVWWALFYGGSIGLGRIWSSLEVTLSHALLVLEFALAFSMFQVTLTLCQGLGLFGRRSASVAANGTVTALLTASALQISASLSSAIQATVIAYVGVAVIALYPILIRWRFQMPRVSQIVAMVRAARPLWINSAIYFLGSAADVLLAAIVLPLAAVGYYRIFKAIATVFLAPFTTLLPLFYSRFASLTRSGRARFYNKVRIGSVGAITAGLMVSAPFFPWVIGETFGERFATRPAVLLAMIVAGGLAFNHNLLGYVATASGIFRIPLIINSAVTIVFLSAAPLLGRQVGLGGFVAGSVLANGVGLLVAARLTQTLVVARWDALVLWPIGAFAWTLGLALWLWGLPIAVGIPLGVGAAIIWSVAVGAAVMGRQVLAGITGPPKAAR